MTTDNKGRNGGSRATQKDHPDIVRTEIELGEMLASIGSPNPGVFVMEYQHDDWCKTLRTGRGSDCNCNPDMKVFRVKVADK